MQKAITAVKKLRTSALQWFYAYFSGMVIIYILLGAAYAAQVWPSYMSKAARPFIELFLVLAVIGHFTLLAFLVSVPGLILLYCLPTKKIFYRATLQCFFCVSIILLLIDIMVYQSYRFHLNTFFLSMFFSKAGSQIFDFSWVEWSVLVIMIAGVIAGVLLWSWIATRLAGRKVNAFLLSLCIVAFGSLLASYFAFVASNVAEKGGLGQQPQALPFYNQIFASLFIKKSESKLIQNAGIFVFDQPALFKGQLTYPLMPLQCQPAKKLPNIIFIVIDTWRSDTINAKGMPNIHQFAKTTWNFKDHRSGGNCTQPGIFSLFYGLPGTYWSAMLQQHRAPVLMDELRRNGYQFGIYGSAPLSDPAFDKTVFLNVPHLQTTTAGATVNQRDQYITQEFLNFIKQAKQHPKPFFGFLFYDEAHSYCSAVHVQQPFTPAVGNCDRLMPAAEADISAYVNRYLNALYQVDQQVGVVLNALKQQRLLDNTIVVITGDHGQEFNDNHQGYWGHASNFTRYQLDTPLLIYWPHKTPQPVNYSTSHYDIAPTLLHQVFSCNTASQNYSMGHSLFKSTKAPYFVADSYINFGIVEPDQIITFYSDGIQVMNANAKPLYGIRPNPMIIRDAFADLQRFYKH